MSADEQGEVPISSEDDIVAARKVVREISMKLAFGITDVTRIVTAASELARNIFQYAETGAMQWRILEKGTCLGIELTFEDQGPGIPNIEKALQPGFSTSGGLGFGLPGAKRLMDEMKIESNMGAGTRVTVRKWHQP